MPDDWQQKSRLASAFLSKQNPLIIFLRVQQAWFLRQEQLLVLMQQALQLQELAQVQQPVI